MRTEELFVVSGTGKEAFTEMARVLESIRIGTRLPNGRCLKDELSDADKAEVETYIIKKLLPEIKQIASEKSRKLDMKREREEEFTDILTICVYTEFHKFNKAEHLDEKDKTYEIGAFIETMAKSAFRDLLLGERGLPVNAIKNMSLVSAAIADIAIEKGINPKSVTREMIHETLSKKKQISLEMIDMLLLLLNGEYSIEEMDESEKNMLKKDVDFESEIKLEMDPHTKAVMDSVFVTFSDLELFILMKEFGFLGSTIGSMTAKEMSYQDYFVGLVRKEKLGSKNIEFGNVRIRRPGRDSSATEELLVEGVYYVKDRYYNNKMAKIRKNLGELAQSLEKDDLVGCLEDYCINIWKERGLNKLFD